jgi:hypothetical protein
MIKEHQSTQHFLDEGIEALMDDFEPVPPKERRRYIFWTCLLLLTMILTALLTVLIERKSRLSLLDYIYEQERANTTLPRQKLTNISYDDHAILINGKRQLLIAGAIHYPRSSPGMWPYLFKQAKEAGINTIDTYVFWNLHEPVEGHYDFDDLIEFLNAAQKENLWVNLRLGPYVCAGNNVH